MWTEIVRPHLQWAKDIQFEWNTLSLLKPDCIKYELNNYTDESKPLINQMAYKYINKYNFKEKDLN